MHKNGLSLAGGKLFYDKVGPEVSPKLFKDCAKVGIDAIEVSVSYDRCLDMDYKSLRKYADEYGVELWSFHLLFNPFSIVDISCNNSKVKNSLI